MKTYFVSFLLAFAASLLFNWMARSVGLRFRLYDAPNGRRLHSRPIPRLGGPAIAAAFGLPLLALLLWDNQLGDAWRAQGTQGLALLLGGFLIMLVGLWDDVHHLRARYKLLGQIAIAVLAYFLGIQIHQIQLPLVGELDMGIFALPVTVFWILGFVNAVNLIDGVDGLCGGVVFIASVTVFFVALISGSPLGALFSAALGGAVLGFLRYNFNPASLFLGDSGSYFLGYVLAIMSILGTQKSSVAVAVLAPLLAVGLPVADTFLAIVRRALNGRPIFAPDRGHIHHRLLDRGYGPKRVVIILYVVSVLFAIGGVLTLFGRQWETGLAMLVILVILIALMSIFGFGRRRTCPEEPAVVNEMSHELIHAITTLSEALPACRSFDDLAGPLGAFAERTRLSRLELLDECGVGFRYAATEQDVSEKGRLDPLLEWHVTLHEGMHETLHVAWRSEWEAPPADTQALLYLLAHLVAHRIETWKQT